MLHIRLDLTECGTQFSLEDIFKKNPSEKELKYISVI